ncbi:Njmu-R1-like isoform X2 [Labeo rohita]|uniref:Njmu-R1-like isoform X2 n=1 Tax=Labeo rohita TaxID=84645 RepID=A0A498N3B6_LABRO|nr:Njmu-R1-like isoform X2 [Labeo rohita]RXN26663.1 Njmu-R1-like isoform X2 [Labeo rohita]
MFTSQTSSFQESIDVDERDADFDNEEIGGYSQKIQQINSYYAIYYYQNTSLTLLDASLPPEAEPELRSYISRRLSKGALLGGMGNIATVELRILNTFSLTLQTFRIELDKYVQGLQGSLTPEMHNLETEVRPYLNRWYEESVMHIHRVVQLLQANVGYLLHAALSHKLVEVTGADEKTKADVARFIKAASLQGLVQEDTTTASLFSNRFCDDWIQAFLNAAERFNPFLLRQILENFKLKAIQDMNNLKRFIRQAEMSHYALFRCCLFLQSCGNGDVLLQNARAEHSSLPEACGIINVLEEFLGEQTQGTAY